MKVERVSYDVITPSAARAVFEAILWKPAMRWKVTRIEVLRPIRWVSVRRNEVGAIASADSAVTAMRLGYGNMGLLVEEHRQQRAGLFLRDVAYRLHARFEVVDASAHVHRYPELRDALPPEPEEHGPENPAKYLAMFQRRAARGQCCWQPYLGCREFSAYFELVGDPGIASRDEPPIPDSADLGWMLYDIDFADEKKPGFFRAQLRDGVIDLQDVEVRR
jgi:CRISPR-associated protein Cas5d